MFDYYLLLKFKHEKLLILSSICFLFVSQLAAQLNVTYISDISYSESLNDIWGYAAPDGTEYALVGAANGTSIVSLADPANPVEVAYVPGANSIWRDIKTWGTFAYVTTDQGNDGLTVIDMTNLPNSVTSTNITNVPGLGTLNTCHNIYIDEFGFAYLAGCNLNNGGMLFYDCATDPANPAYVGPAPNAYSHDVYVRNNLMYSSEIYAGVFGIYDVSDKNNVTLLGNQNTAFNFTHNTWLSDDGNFLFTTDEQGNAPIGSYDVSDPTDILEMDQFVPLITEGDGVIPHNVHVWNDWIIISYYTDGCIVVDGANPGNLIEVGNFDTYVPASTGFNGTWGAYPYLPSGLILLSDIGNGLYVLEPNYVRACWLEGTVIDSISGQPINGASIEIQASQLNGDESDATGAYATGLATAGTYDVVYSANGYISKTYEAVMDNDLLTIIDAELVSVVPAYAITANVISSVDGSAIANAVVEVVNGDNTYVGTTDMNGDAEFPYVFQGNYQIFAGKWGYKTDVTTANVQNPESFTVEIDPGYRDEFAVDLGWVVTGDAATGTWTLGDPVGTTSGGNQSNPENDISGDLGFQCYVTGNGGGGAGNDDVDNGTTTLTSPSMDLASLNEPIVSFYAWFFNSGGQGTPDDALEIRVNNGTSEVVIDIIDASSSQWDGPLSYLLSDYITLTNNMTVIFETSDFQGSGNLVEAAIDLFEITESIDYPVFSSSAVDGCAPFVVDFTDNGSNATSWAWTFEGGNPASSTLQNPSVTYNTAGTYSVSLSVITPSGQAAVSEDDIIVVSDVPIASFSFDADDFGVATFTNNSNNADSYSWDFGDGSSSTDSNPTHTYASSDFYTVTMTATNACGSVTTTQTVPINISVSVADINKNLLLTASPNPFTEAVQIQYDLQQNFEQARLVVYDILGQQVMTQNIQNAQGIIIVDDFVLRGIYLARIEVDGVASESIKLVKAE